MGGNEVVPKFDGMGNAKVWMLLFEEAAGVRKRAGHEFWRRQCDWPKRAAAYFTGAAEVWAGTVTGLLTPAQAVRDEVEKMEDAFAAAHLDPPKLLTAAEMKSWRVDRIKLDDEIFDKTKDVWSAFRCAFMARFAPHRTMGELTSLLVESRRLPGESDRTFSERLRRIVQDVPAAEVDWNTIARTFMRPQTEAIRIHFASDSMLCKSEAAFQKLVDDLLELQRGQGAEPQRAGVTGGTGGRGCWTCGEVGHRSKDCPRIVQGGISQTGGAGRGPAMAAGGGGMFRGGAAAGSAVGRGAISGRGMPIASGRQIAPTAPIAAVSSASMGRGVAGTEGRGVPAGRGRFPVSAGRGRGDSAGGFTPTCNRCGKLGHVATRCRASIEEVDAFQGASAVAAVESADGSLGQHGPEAAQQESQ
jgi:hypothetical protein